MSIREPVAKESFFPPVTSFRQKVVLILLGMLLLLVFLEVSLRLCGFALLSKQENGNFQSIRKKGAYRIMCLGESTTQGQYPQFLEEILNQQNTGTNFSVVDKGRIGATTTIILSQVEGDLEEYHPDLVVAMMGVNDQGGHIPYEAVTTSKFAFFLRSLRVYKLIRFLWLNIYIKGKEVGFYIFKDEKAYVELGSDYRKQGNFPEAVAVFKKAVDINPRSVRAHMGLGASYRDQEKIPLAENTYKNAMKNIPESEEIYVGLAWLYKYQGKFVEAEDVYKKAIQVNPGNDPVYIELGWLYQRQGKFADAEQIFKKAIMLDRNSARGYRAISVLYELMGEPEAAKEYAETAKRLTLTNYSVVTMNNYRKLKEILDKKRMRLVCVQYPMRSVESLKEIFEKDSGVIFVDNQTNFKEAIRRTSVKSVFKDMFGGDFGHCTEKGNWILAENIAEVILKEVVGK